MKGLLIALALIVLLSGCVDLTEMAENTEISSLKSQVSNYKEKISDKDGTISKFRDQVIDAEDALEYCRNTVNTENKEIKEKLTELKYSIQDMNKTLNLDINLLKNTIQDLNMTIIDINFLDVNIVIDCNCIEE